LGIFNTLFNNWQLLFKILKKILFFVNKKLHSGIAFPEKVSADRNFLIRYFLII